LTKSQALPEQQNQTVAGAPPQVLTRGPQVESAPAPKLPSYLKNQNLKTSVLIEFLVTASGVSTPSLIGSSGNEEVDRLAAKGRSAMDLHGRALNEGKIDRRKVRLRINFEVD